MFAARGGFVYFEGAAPPPGFPAWPTVPTWGEMNTEFSTNYVTSGNATVEWTNFGVINDTGGNQRRHGVAHPNGNIYLLPRTNPSAVVYNPASNVATLLNTGFTDHQGGALSGYNGKIYCPPHETSSNTSILEIDPANTTSRTILGVLTTNGFQGAISLGNNILFVDCYSTTGTGANSYIYNVEANTATVTNLNVATNLEYTGGALHPNGNIYFPPYNGSYIVEYDPVNNVKTNKYAIGGTGTGKYNSFCLGADGLLWAGPSNRKNILRYDPITNTAIQSTYGLTLTQGYLEGALGSDGNIYMCTAPYFTNGTLNNHLIICTDPANPAYNTAVHNNFGIASQTNINNAWGMVAGANNTILSVNEGFGTGSVATNVFKITTTGSASYDSHLSPYLNKGL